VHTKLQAAALPDSVTMVLASFTHAVWMAVQAAGGSQVSPDSTAPLPQLGWQSLSLMAVQPVGQQASLLAQALCSLPFTHWTSHDGALPWGTRNWQPRAGQLVGQLPSQISPVSTIPLPQRGVQSGSEVALQELGQQASSATHAVWTAPSTQCASQVDAAPCSDRSWQPTGSHFDGQLPSQISPGSTTPLPQTAPQSESRTLLHPLGQQASPLAQEVVGADGTQAAWQVPAFESENC
jgi:hypothetical protein